MIENDFLSDDIEWMRTQGIEAHFKRMDAFFEAKALEKAKWEGFDLNNSEFLTI